MISAKALPWAAVVVLAAAGCGDDCLLTGECSGGDEGGVDHQDTADDTGLIPLWELPPPPGDASWGDDQATHPPGASQEQVEALEAVNGYRTAVGLGTVDQHEALNAAAQSHALFIVDHCQDYASSGVSPHEEVEGWEGYTGKDPWDRAAYFGYGSMNLGEVIAFVNDPEAAVRTWMDSLYHRLAVLDPRAVKIGYGTARGHGSCTQPLFLLADVMDIGMGQVQADATAFYPPDGAQDVPVAFHGFETPQPPPPPNGYPSGYIVTVQFAKKIGFKVLSHRLLDAHGSEVLHLFLAPYGDEDAGVIKDPNASAGANYVALYAYEPLEFGTTYTVEIELDRGGQDVGLSWSFTTEAP